MGRPSSWIRTSVATVLGHHGMSPPCRIRLCPTLSIHGRLRRALENVWRRLAPCRATILKTSTRSRKISPMPSESNDNCCPGSRGPQASLMSTGWHGIFRHLTLSQNPTSSYHHRHVAEPSARKLSTPIMTSQGCAQSSSTGSFLLSSVAALSGILHRRPFFFFSFLVRNKAWNACHRGGLTEKNIVLTPKCR